METKCSLPPLQELISGSYPKLEEASTNHLHPVVLLSGAIFFLLG
jgi:hypothetical protein